MLSHTDLKKGKIFILNGQPHLVLESSFVFKGRGSSIVQGKIKNLVTGNILSRTFHPGEEFEEAEIQKIKLLFLYSHRGQFWFQKEEDPSIRFSLPENILGENTKFLKPKTSLEGLFFEDKIINISLPIKMVFKVIEAPPGVKGDRAQAGTKTVTIETGAKINAPLFIEEGDWIEVNTETGQYTKRVES